MSQGKKKMERMKECACKERSKLVTRVLRDFKIDVQWKDDKLVLKFIKDNKS